MTAEWCQACGEEPAVVDTDRGWMCHDHAAASDRLDEERVAWDRGDE